MAAHAAEGGEIHLPWNLFDDNSSDILARAAAARTLADRLSAPATSRLAANVSGVGSLAHASSNLSGDASLGATTQRAAPRVFFLFLAYSGLNHMDLWAAFFEHAPRHKWKAFIHCVDSANCSRRLSFFNAFDLKLVDSAPSEYCHDLVSPMVQLLRVASAEGKHANDKFVFLSESTLPVKPFWRIYKTLSTNANSDICFEPRREWIWLKNKKQPALHSTLVKHSQWVVLNRAHAQHMIRRWPHIAGSSKSSWSVPVWKESQTSDYSEADFATVPRFKLCLDEWAIFAALFGVVMTNQEFAELPGLSSPRLDVGAASTGRGQGVCRTFVTWGESTERETSKLAQKIPYLLSCYPNCRGYHPAHFRYMTDFGLRTIVSSDFLFARKFPPGVVTLKQFQRIVLWEGR